MGVTPIVDALANVEKNRRTLVFRCLVLGIVLLSFLLLLYKIIHLPLIGLFAIALFVSVLGIIIVLPFWVDTYKDQFKNILIKNVVATIAPEMDYSNKEIVSETDINLSSVYSKTITSVTTNGDFNSKNVYGSLLSIGAESKSSDKQRKKRDFDHIVVTGFYGLFLMADKQASDLNIDDLGAELVVIRKGVLSPTKMEVAISSTANQIKITYISAQQRATNVIEKDEALSARYPGVWKYTRKWENNDLQVTGNSEFDSVFNVYSQKKETVEKYLGKEVQKRLVEYAGRNEQGFSFSFAIKRCYSAFTMNPSTLKPVYLRSIGKTTQTEIENDIHNIEHAITTTSEIAKLVYHT